MENIVIISLSIISIIIMRKIFDINIKKIKNIGMNEQLNQIAEKYPKNKEICQKILRKLKNEKVKIEEKEEAETTMYIAITDKILIANTKGSFSRIQTMAHECIHSIQPRRLLIFNFIYSNIYMIYYFIIILLIILKVLPNELLFLNIYLIMSLIYYMIRMYLENEAMFKAKHLAKEYMEEEKISSKEEREKVVEGFEELNKIGIKSVNYSTLTGILTKVVFFSIVALIF